jgi:probable phosphoglycerate mutase
MAPPRLYLTRHAETEWNVARRLQGREDSPLTARGRTQTEALAAVAPALGVRRILASPLGRARATAGIVALACEAPLTFHDALAEVSFGAAACGTVDEAVTRWPESWAARRRDRWNTRWPEGESYADAAARIAAWLPEGAPLWRAATTLIVAHHSLLRAFLVAALAWPIERALAAGFPACEPLEPTAELALVRPPLPATPPARS